MDSTVTVQELMDREYVGVSESDEVSEAAELMLAEESESAVVLRGGESRGVLTARDALGALVKGDGDSPVREAMQTDVPTVSPEATIGEAASVMSSQGSRHLVVTEGDRTVGTLGERALVTTSLIGSDKETLTARSEATTDGVLAAAGSAAERDVAAETDGFEDQSICEACGRLVRDLSTFNGQLLCEDCRDM